MSAQTKYTKKIQISGTERKRRKLRDKTSVLSAMFKSQDTWLYRMIEP